MSSPRNTLPTDLLDALRSNLDGVEVITTVSQGRPNWIDRVEPEGVLVETESSRKKGAGPLCALLARLDGVTVASSRPIKLRYRRPSSDSG